jgi:hypothetical protein
LLVVGITVALLGAVVPSATWVELLRTDTEPALLPGLLTGASLFRAGLVLLGVYAIAGWKLGWWEQGLARNERRAFDPWLWALLALALGMRVYRLDDGLWYDEVLTLVDYVRLPLGDLATTFEGQNQHFLFSLLARTSVAVFGEHAFALRLPAVLFGVAGIWALYDFAREVGGRREALLACALMTVSYHHVWFSQNARGYTGVLFFTLLSSTLLLRALADGRGRSWLAYGTALALGGYTHLTMIVVALSHLTLYCAALFRGKLAGPARWQPVVSGFVFAGLLAGTLYAFGIPQFIDAELERGTLPAISTWVDPIWALQEALRGFQLDLGAGALVGVAGLVVLLLGCASFVRDRYEVVVLFAVSSGLVVFVAIATGHHLWPRSFFLVAGFALLLLVRGGMLAGELIARVLKRPEWGARVGIAGTLAVCVVSAATVPLAYGPKQDFVGARDAVEAERQDGDRVVAVGIAIHPFTKHFAPHWESAADAEALRVIRGASRRTWVVNIFPPYLEDRHPDIVALLASEFDEVGVYPGTVGAGEVFVYRSR